MCKDWWNTWHENKIMSTYFALFILHHQNCCPFLNLWYLVSTFWILIGYHKEKIEDNNRSFEKWKMLAPTKIVMFFETPTHHIMPCNVPYKYNWKKKLRFYKLPHLLPNEVRTDCNWSLEASHKLWCEVHNIYFALVCLFP
jgi:hypothetical protein